MFKIGLSIVAPVLSEEISAEFGKLFAPGLIIGFATGVGSMFSLKEDVATKKRNIPKKHEAMGIAVA